ncbi:MAG: FISUMP domain-containing protein [Bacteroidales bacterium]
MRNLILLLFFLIPGNLAISQTVTDYDGNIYNTIVIGTQVWMQKDLKVTHYNDGTLIPNITDSASWPSLTTGARCYYNNDSATHDSVYGALYNWYAATNSKKICPVDWHVPTDGQWTALENYLGGSFGAGGPLKEAGTLHWLSPNYGATNSSGFTGLPGGARAISMDFSYLHENGLYWTYSSYNTTLAWSRYLWYMNNGVDRNPTMKYLGLSIRCMRDAPAGTQEINSTDMIKIFPNPGHGEFVAVLPYPYDQANTRLSVYNGIGILIFQNTFSGNLGTRTIDLNNFADGIYFLRFESGQSNVISKVVVER